LGLNTKFGYYTQTDLQYKEGQKVIEIIKEIADVITLEDGREITASQLLNLFLFDPKSQYDHVSKLSGGERRRLQLLKVLMGNPNFLVLDEPTNDLDIMTLNILEDYLDQFSGCLMIVSHDRYFMDRLVESLFVFEGDGKINVFNGNYTDYRESVKLKDVPALNKSATQKKEREKVKEKVKLTFNEKKEMEQLEKDIASLETDKKALKTKLNNGSESHEELMEWSKDIEKITNDLEEKEMRWLELSELA